MDDDARTSRSLLWLPAVVVVGTVCLGVRVVLDGSGGNAGGAAQLVWWTGLVTLAAILAAVYVRITGDRWLLVATGLGLVAIGVYGLRSGWPYLPGGVLFVIAGTPSVWRHAATGPLLVAAASLATIAIAFFPSAS